MKLVSTLALMLLSTTLFAAEGTPTPPTAQPSTPAVIEQGPSTGNTVSAPAGSVTAQPAAAPAKQAGAVRCKKFNKDPKTGKKSCAEKAFYPKKAVAPKAKAEGTPAAPATSSPTPASISAGAPVTQ